MIKISISLAFKNNQNPKNACETDCLFVLFLGSVTAGTTVKNSGPWQCDTCLINNKEEATKCIACETPRPGSKSTSGLYNIPAGVLRCFKCFKFLNACLMGAIQF